MSQSVIDNIWTFKTRSLAVIVDALEDDYPDAAIEFMDEDAAAETVAKISAGELVMFCVRARVLFHGREIASDYLGSCIYANVAEFRDHMAAARENRGRKAAGLPGEVGSYFGQMVRDAIHEARREMLRLAVAAGALRKTEAAA